MGNVLPHWLCSLGFASRVLALSLALSAATSIAADECQCLWQGSFAEVAFDTDLVILGTIKSVKGNAVDVELERVLRGDTWREDLRVWMKTRHYCRPETAMFPIKSRWIMAIDEIQAVPADGFNPSTPNVSYGRKHDYQLSSCGGYFLMANGDAVIGNLVPGMPRWEVKPAMTPVLIELVERYMNGDISMRVLIEASREDPSVKNLILDTRSFLRGQGNLIEPP